MLATFLPILVLVVVLVVRYLLAMIGLMDFGWFYTLFWVIATFGFGLSLNPKHKRSNTWVLKLIISFIVFLLFTYQMGWLSLPWISQFLSSLVIYLIYVWCGWAFFRN